MKIKLFLIAVLCCCGTASAIGQTISYSNSKPSKPANTRSNGACNGSYFDSSCGSACGECSTGCDSGCGILSGRLFQGGLFRRGCDSACGGCDTGCNDCGSGCGLLGGGFFNRGCGLIGGGLGFFQMGCGSGCDTGCSSGCNSGCGSACCGTNDCGRYIAIHGGLNSLNRYVGAAPPAPPTSFQRIQDFNEGWALGGAIGRKLGNGNRAELEFNYRNNTTDMYTINAFQNGMQTGSMSYNSYGEVNSYTGMFNLYRDLQGLGNGFFTPYIGGGVGFTKVDADWSAPAINATYHIDETAFSAQLMAGVTVPLSGNVDLFGEYRYFTTEGVDIFNGMGGLIGDFNYENSNVLVGIKINTN